MWALIIKQVYSHSHHQIEVAWLYLFSNRMSKSRLPKLNVPVWDHNRLLVDRIQSVKSTYCTRSSNPQVALRQNRLDAMFLNRKHKLEEISRENMLIHQRIFTQKSSYSFTKGKSVKNLHHKSRKHTDLLAEQDRERRDQLEKQSELSTAFQTVSKKEVVQPEALGTRLVSEVMQQTQRAPKESRVKSQRTKSCKQIKTLSKVQDFIII